MVGYVGAWVVRWVGAGGGVWAVAIFRPCFVLGVNAFCMNFVWNDSQICMRNCRSNSSSYPLFISRPFRFVLFLFSLFFFWGGGSFFWQAALELTYTAKDADYVYGSPSCELYLPCGFC